MSVTGQGRSALARILPALALGAVLASVARGSDPVPVQSAPNDDSIAAAQVELDALKSEARKPAGTQPSALPSLDLPRLDAAVLSTSAGTVSPSGVPDERARRRSKNWLVDGVMNQDRAHAAADRSRSRDPRDPGRMHAPATNGQDGDEGDALSDPRGEPSAAARRTDRTAGPDAKDPTAVTYDPFAQFMPSWLASDDYAALRRTVEPPGGRSAAADFAPVAGVGAPAGASTPLPPGIALPGAAQVGDRAPSAPLVNENPFLQFLNAPEAAAAPTPPVAPVQAAAPPAPPPQPAPPPAIAPGSLPDFVKPSLDDKYFKPLKRF